MQDIYTTSNLPFCVYLTVYSGNKLPPYYIGSSSTKKVLTKDYYGSVVSKKYKELWKSELKNNPQLFDILILSEHETRKEALEEELRIQKLKNVVKNPDFINLSYASVNGFFGMECKGEANPNFGKSISDEQKEKVSKGVIAFYDSLTPEQHLEHFKNHKDVMNNPETKEKLSIKAKERFANKTEEEKQAFRDKMKSIQTEELRERTTASIKEFYKNETVEERLIRIEKTRQSYYDKINAMSEEELFEYTLYRKEIMNRPEIKENLSIKAKARFENLTEDEYIEYCLKQKSIMSNPETIEKLSIKGKERFADEEFRKKHKESCNTKEYKQLRREMTTEMFKDETIRKKHNAAVNTKEYKKRQSEMSIERCKDPEYRTMLSDRQKASTEKRLATRKRNQELKEQLLLDSKEK